MLYSYTRRSHLITIFCCLWKEYICRMPQPLYSVVPFLILVGGHYDNLFAYCTPRIVLFLNCPAHELSIPRITDHELVCLLTRPSSRDVTLHLRCLLSCNVVQLTCRWCLVQWSGNHDGIACGSQSAFVARGCCL